MSKIALVAIGRRENLYAVEFVEHYQKLGFDNIYILDNNHEEDFALSSVEILTSRIVL